MPDLAKTIRAAVQQGQQSLDRLVHGMTPRDMLINYDTLVANGVTIDTDKIATSLAVYGNLSVAWLNWYLSHDRLTSQVMQLASPDWAYNNCRHLLDHSELDVADVANALKPWQISDLAGVLHDAGLELCNLQTIEISMIPSLVEAGYQVGDIIRHKAALDVNNPRTSNDVVVSDMILLAEQGCLSDEMKRSSLRKPLSATDMRRLHRAGISWDLILDSQSILDALKIFGMDDDPEVQASLARQINECQPYVVDELSQLAEALASQCSGLVATALARKISVRALADNLDAFLESGADVAAIADRLSLEHPGEALRNYNKLTSNSAQINAVDCLHRWLTRPFSRGPLGTPWPYSCSSADEFCTACLLIEQEVGHTISLADFSDHELDEASVLVDATIDTLTFLLERQMPLAIACQLIDPWIIISDHQRLQANYGLTNTTLSKLVNNWLHSLAVKQDCKDFIVGSNELDILLSLDGAIDFSDRASELSNHFSIDYVIGNYARFVARGIRIDFEQICHFPLQRLDLKLLDEQIDNLSSSGATARDILLLLTSLHSREMTTHIVNSLIHMANHDQETLDCILHRLSYGLDDATLLRFLHEGASPLIVISRLRHPELVQDELLSAGLDPSTIYKYINKR